MRTFGFFVMAAGIIWALFAFQMNTTVSTVGYSSGGFSIPSQTVHNIGLLEERRTNLMLAGFTALAGVMLIGFGSQTSPGEGGQGSPSKSPTIRVSVSDQKTMDQFGISVTEGQFQYGDYKYPTLEQALIHAKAAKAIESR